MEPRFVDLCRRFGLAEPSAVTPLRGGTAARVWRLDTDEGVFLLRTLPGPKQGQREWEIHSHLAAGGFHAVTSLVQTRDGLPAAEQGGAWYQLQRFLPGKIPDPAVPGTARKIARLVKNLDEALADCPLSGQDHAPMLSELWQRGKAFWPCLNTPFTAAQAEGELARCVEREVQLIHGDLGLWNMIGTPAGELCVIDFGTARLGDPGFDCAAALGGLINHTPAELRHGVCREFVAELSADRAWLLEQLRIWCWRNLAQWACLAGSGADAAPMAGRFLSALHWAEENLYEL